MRTCNCFRTFDRVARKIVYTTWAWQKLIDDARGEAEGIMARSAEISTFCICSVIYYFYPPVEKKLRAIREKH